MPSQRSSHQQRVDFFMIKASQVLPGVPTVPDVKIRALRARLILEEALEAVKALGFTARANILKLDGMTIELEALFEPDLVEIADGCADIKVVTTGTLSACGIADEKLQLLVDENNLAKFGPGHRIRADGKLIKPPEHKPPDVWALLTEQGWDGEGKV